MPDIPDLQQLRRHADIAMKHAAEDYRIAKSWAAELDDAIAMEAEKRHWNGSRLVVILAALAVGIVLFLAIEW